MSGPIGLDLVVGPSVIAAPLRPVRIGERGRVGAGVPEQFAGEAVKLAEVLPQAIGRRRAALLVHQCGDMARLDLGVLRPPDGVPDPVEPEPL